MIMGGSRKCAPLFPPPDNNKNPPALLKLRCGKRKGRYPNQDVAVDERPSVMILMVIILLIGFCSSACSKINQVLYNVRPSLTFRFLIS